MNGMRSSIAVLTVVILAGGCTVKTERLEVNPSFNYSALASGRLGIAAVSIVGGKLSEQDRELFGEMLKSAIKKDRKQLSVAGPGETAYLLGAERYRELMTFLSGTTVLNHQWIEELGEKTKDRRYVLFGIITQDTVARSSFRNSQPIYDSSGKVQEWRDFEVRSTRREMRLDASVYDLRSQELAWEAILSAHEENKYELPVQPDAKLPKLKDVVIDMLLQGFGGSNAGQQQPDPFPPAPTQFGLVSKIFKQLADKLQIGRAHV